jgi:hypothetical protein
MTFLHANPQMFKATTVVLWAALRAEQADDVSALVLRCLH